MAKINLKKGLAGRLIGAVAGGATSAVLDEFVMPMLGPNVETYSDYVKVGVGAVLPAVVKGNAMVDSIGDALMAIGANKIVGGLIAGSGETVDVPDTTTTTDTTTPKTAGVLVNGIGTGRFAGYSKYASKSKSKTANVTGGFAS